MAPPREAEEKEGRRSTSFFLPCLRFLCTQEFGGHFFFAFAHFLLYTKDPDLLQALDLPVMPASAAGEAAMARRRWRRLCLLLLKAKVTLKLTWRRRRGRRRYSRSRGSKAFFIDSPPAASLLQPPLVTKAFQSRLHGHGHGPQQGPM